QVALAYGGFDLIFVTAGIFVPSDTKGHIADDKWALTFNINVTGSYLVGDEAAKTWKEQGLRGKLVLTSSANAVVAKKGSVAYDASKAAANHLVRELAIELAPLVRVNGVAPATVVKGSAMFPRDRVIGSLAKYDLPYRDDEETESLVNKRAQFYADLTLTRSPITPADQAEAYFLLVSDRLSKTTGQIITVDGGCTKHFFAKSSAILKTASLTFRLAERLPRHWPSGFSLFVGRGERAAHREPALPRHAKGSNFSGTGP